MSGLRLGAKEAAYFFQESKHAVARLRQTPKMNQNINPDHNSNSNSNLGDGAAAAAADILPEILRHSLPRKILDTEIPCESSVSTSAKWSLGNSSNSSSSYVSADVMNPLRAHVSLPQVSLGPKRWQLPRSECGVTASTANELRGRTDTVANPDKVRAAAEGLAQIGKAFAIATGIIFGSAALAFGFAASKLHIHTSDDIRTKGRDLVRPKYDTIKEQLGPLRHWAEYSSKKWRLKSKHNVKEKPIIKELSKILHAKDSA